MENFEKVANEILAYINDKKTQTAELLSPISIRFILCGSSGSGKTSAVNLANKDLSEAHEIAESSDILYVKDLSKALDIINDRDLKYQDSKYIGFNVIDKDLAKQLELAGRKVFWFDK